MMSLAQAAADLAADGNACCLLGDGSVVFDAVSIDSRTLGAGALYIALRGERFDGHAFAAAAHARGAVALMVEQRAAAAELAGVPQIVVPDTHDALGRLAAAWRGRFAFPVIAVAGSNGKTTTTQMIAAILAAAFGDSGGRPAWFATRGNRNNAIGVPLMLLELRAVHRAAVLELGMNHPGEMQCLSRWVRPDVALVTNAQREHQEFLDSVEATARENGAVIEALPSGGTAVFPADDACAPIWRRAAAGRRVLDFALDAPAAVRGHAAVGPQSSTLRLASAAGDIDVSADIAVGGLHNARNALAAAAACLAAGIDAGAIGTGLAAFAPVGGRGTFARAASGALLIDESYNANPDSVRAAIELLARQGAPRVLVLGDMGEVGARGPEFHREVGAYARACGIERLLALGDQSAAAVAAFGTAGTHFSTVEALIDAVRGAAGAGPGGAVPSVLVKGSRFMRLERVIAALAGNGTAGPGSEPHA
jgi:UDP-N-acetylmuramoyl-tripeptide--D-alanyl-D-alanine ligase